MKVAIVHEWLDSYAGSERVVEQLLAIWPEADLFAVCDFLPPDGARLPRRPAGPHHLHPAPALRAPALPPVPAADAAGDRAARPVRLRPGGVLLPRRGEGRADRARGSSMSATSTAPCATPGTCSTSTCASPGLERGIKGALTRLAAAPAAACGTAARPPAWTCWWRTPPTSPSASARSGGGRRWWCIRPWTSRASSRRRTGRARRAATTTSSPRAWCPTSGSTWWWRRSAPCRGAACSCWATGRR